MRRSIQALFFGLFLTSTAIAGEIGYRGHTPSQSPFKVIGTEIPTASQSSVEYRGRATIRAKYRFEYVQESGQESGQVRNLHLDLSPEPESLSLLPYLTRWANESGTSANKVLVTDAPKEIWVTNVTEAATALLGEELAADLMAGKYEVVDGEASVVIEGFRADYTCSSAFFTTTVVKAEKEIAAPATTKLRLVTR